MSALSAFMISIGVWLLAMVASYRAFTAPTGSRMGFAAAILGLIAGLVAGWALKLRVQP